MDSIELRNEIKRRGYTVQRLAEQLKISDVTLYRKINGEYPFNENELLFLSSKLRLKPEDITNRTAARKEIKQQPEQKIIINNNVFKLTLTGRNYDYIAVVENKVNEPITIYFNNKELPPLKLAARDWLGILANEEGLEAIHELKNKNYKITKKYKETAQEIEITKLLRQLEKANY